MIVVKVMLIIIVFEPVEINVAIGLQYVMFCVFCYYANGSYV